MDTKRERVLSMLGVGLIFLIIGIFCFYNYTFAVDFPYMDDFMLVLFVYEYSTLDLGLIDFLNKLFQSANSHKMVIPRLIALIDFGLTGDLNFRSYQLIVTINILMVISLMYHHFRKLGLSVYYFVPVVLLMLHPQYYDISLFALNGIQHTTVLLFSLLSIHFLTKDKPYSLPVAIAFCFLSTFSHGNGFFSFCGILFYLLANRQFKKLAWTSLWMAIILTIFLYKTNDSGMARFPESLLLFLGSFFAFIGATMAQSANFGNLLAITTGLLIIIFVGTLILHSLFKFIENRTDQNKQLIFWLSFFSFIIGTSLIITLLRSWSGLLIASRFQIYAALSMAVAYILLLVKYKRLRNFKFASIVIIGCVVVNVHSYYYFSDVVLGRKTQFVADIYNWKRYRTMFSVGKDYLDNSDYFFSPAFESNLFLTQTPVLPEKGIPHYFNNSSQSEIEITTDISIVSNGNNIDLGLPEEFIISNNDMPGSLPFSGMRFLVVYNTGTEQQLLISAVPIKSSQFKLLTGSPYYSSGFKSYIRERDLLEGNYQIGVMDVIDSNVKQFYKCNNQYLHVTSSGIMEILPIQSSNINE